MFETTNQNAMIYLNLPSKLAETTNQYWLDNNNSYSWFTHIYPLKNVIFHRFLSLKGHGFHRLHFTSWHRVHRVAVCASGGWWRPWSPGCGSCLTALNRWSPVRNPMICRVQTRQTGIKEFITCNWTLWNLKSIQRIVKHFETQHSQMDGDSAMFMRLGFQMVRFQLKSWELLSLKHGFTTCQVGMGHKSKLMYQWNHQLGHPY